MARRFLLLVALAAGHAAGQTDVVLPACTSADNATLLEPYKALLAPCLAAVNQTSTPTGIISNPALFCASTSCQSLSTAAGAILSKCTPPTSVVPGKFCDPACVEAITGWREHRRQCIGITSTTYGLCYTCKKYLSSVSSVVATCQIQDSAAAIRQDVDVLGMVKICDAQTNPTTAPVATSSDSNNTTYIVIGCIAGVVLLGAVVFACLRTKKPRGDVYSSNGQSYRANGSNRHLINSGNNSSNGGGTSGNPSSTAHHMNTRVANDIRFDTELSQFRIPQQEIQNISLLVKGGYGVVFHATFGKQDVAMKQLLPSKAKDSSAIQDFMNEIRLCARLEHPKIVKFVGISWSTLQDLAVLSEFMSNGDVTGLIRKERKKPEGSRLLQWYSDGVFPATKTSIAADTADALVYLHSFQPTVIHRDLKSKNVLLSETWEAKLSDFGISRVTSLEESMTSNIGTIAWIAPEVLTGGRYTEKADIYSFGVLMAELDTLQVPYADMLGKSKENGFSNARLAMMVSEGALQPSFTESMPSELLALARECLSFHDNDRPSAVQLSYRLHKLLQHMRIVDIALLAIAGLVAGQSDEATLPVCDASVNITFTTKFKPLFDQCSNVTGGVEKMLGSPLYCKTPACTSSMEIAHSVLSTCAPVAGMYFTPGRLCTPECVNKTTQVRNIRSQCLSASTGALGLCFQCKNYAIEMKAYRAICEVLDTVEALRNDKDIKAAAAICFTPAPTTLPPSSDSTSTTYVVIGCVVGVLLVAAVLFVCLRKKTPKGDVYTSAGNTTNGSGNLHSMRLRSGETTNQTGNTRVANDIRFDAELSQFRIPQQEIQNISLLVKGGYGVVFHATFGKQDVAMKQLLPSKAKDAAAIQDFMNEIRLCARLEHPKIVKFVGISWSTVHDLAVLSEFMSNGDVTGLIRKERKKPEGSRLLHWFPQGSFPATKTSISADTADALVYLHSFQPTVIHRDLKSKNVLLSETWEAKLSDFGISRVTSLEESMTSNIGTIAWIAPEVLTGGRYTEKADIYSFGVLMAELDTLQVPYADLLGKASENGFSNARLAMMVSEGELQPSFTESMPSELLALARECLSFHDNDRPSAIQLSYKLHKILNENKANYQ